MSGPLALYERYASTQSGIHSGTEVDLAFKRDFMAQIPDGAVQILDIGCGQGGLVRLCHESGFHEAYGVDLSKEQIGLGQAAGVANLAVGDALEALRDAEQPLDVVFASDLLEHLPRDLLLDVVHAVHDALAPGGVLVARTPNGASPFSGFYFSGDATHEQLLSPRSLRQIALHCGFEETAALSCRPLPHGLKSFARACLWRPCEAAIRTVIRIETGQSAEVVTQNFVFIGKRGAA